MNEFETQLSAIVAGTIEQRYKLSQLF